jgi:DNA helicase HerA-like ATPase
VPDPSVLGRLEAVDSGPAAALGRYRASDGSDGASVALDVDAPHAGLVVGKRGSGKSHTLGVLAEELARAAGVAPILVDPMGAFGGLADLGLPVREPRVRAGALPAAAWPGALGLDSESGAGALVWRAAADADTLTGVRDRVTAADADREVRRAARNHLDLAAAWGVFDPDGLDPSDLRGGAVLDCAGLPRPGLNAAVRALAAGCYERALKRDSGPLPWWLVDEAHALDGVAAPALRRLLTRGRAPGVSVVLATQRPAALPEVAVSQADLLVVHRLTARDDLEALAAARPTYLAEPLDANLPAEPGTALVLDDATERAHAVRIRERATPHGGESPRATDRAGSG